MATLETAIMVPVLLAVTFIFISLLNVGMQTLSLSDATRTAARELARGADPNDVVAAFRDREPGAQIDVRWEDSTVTVLTARSAELIVNPLGFGGFDLKQSHTAPREWN